MLLKNVLTMFNKVGKFMVGDSLFRFTISHETRNINL